MIDIDGADCFALYQPTTMRTQAGYKAAYGPTNVVLMYIKCPTGSVSGGDESIVAAMSLT